MVAPSSVTLSDYLGRLRRILHDPNDVYWQASDKILYINEAIQQRDAATGGIRRLGTFTLTTNQTTYSFTDLSAAFTSPTGNIFDIISITLLYNGFRILLDTFSYSEMVSVPGHLAYINTFDRPAAWCRYADTNIVIGPAPSFAYQIEIDATIYSVPTLLSNPTDPDVLTFPYTEPVAWYAAYLCKLNERQYDEAEMFKQVYGEKLADINALRTGMVPSMYPRGTTRVS